MDDFMKNQKIKVSIIIPVYNCEGTLSRAIDSVIKQSYKNIQVVLIDDGSKDNSPYICEQYALKDSRVEVIHQNNAGASCARNTGLEKVKGEYVAFIDADDVVSEYYVEILLYSATITNTKISTCETYYCVDNEYKVQQINEVVPQVIKVENYNFMEGWSHATVWGALFHNSLLINLKFDTSISVGEDSLFFVNALVKCDNISYVSNKLYYYFMYNNSLSHGTYNEKRLTEFVAWKKINNIVVANSNILDTSSKARMAEHAIERYKEALRQNQADNKILNYLRGIIRENRIYYTQYNSTNKAKIEILFISKIPEIHKLLYKVYKCKIRNFLDTIAGHVH